MSVRPLAGYANFAMSPDKVSEYRAQVVTHSAPLRGTDSWVNWVNAAADRLREIAIQEAAQDSTGSQFAVLLDDESPAVRVWAAHHILELFGNRSFAVQQQALNVVEEATRGDSAAALGERMWLEEWRREHQAGELNAAPDADRRAVLPSAILRSVRSAPVSVRPLAA